MNEALTKPIEPQEIDWRIQSKKNGKTHVLAYIDNRAVMERLDKAFGPDGWQNSYERWGDGAKCGIGVFVDGGWVWKYDGAPDTKVESIKGGFSDSMKRAAVQWGLGRDLYDYPVTYIEGEHNYIPDWALERLHKMTQAIIAGKDVPKFVTIKQ